MVQNSVTHWRAKKCDKTPLGNVNKEKSHFSSYFCFVLASGTFVCVPVWRILYHATSSCKGPIKPISTVRSRRINIDKLVIIYCTFFCLSVYSNMALGGRGLGLCRLWCGVSADY